MTAMLSSVLISAPRTKASRVSITKSRFGRKSRVSARSVRCLSIVAGLFLCVLPRLSDAAVCAKVSEVCVEGPATRSIKGIDVDRSCWRYAAQFECRSESRINDCQPLRDKGCEQIGSNCLSREPGGACLQFEQVYRCVDRPEQKIDKTVCESTFCQTNGNGCFDTSAPPDSDFGRAAAMLEVARQAGVYGVDADSLEIFKGYTEHCGVKVLGGDKIKSCCSSSGGGAAFTNQAVLQTGASVAKGVAKEGLRAGSRYVYDSLYKTVDSGIMQKGLGALNSWGKGLGAGTFNPVFSFYGFSFSFSMASGFQFVAFDPYSFAAQIAIMMIMKWLECDSSTQVLALKRGQNLCVHVGTVCDKKALGVCIERKEQHCCFNSKLAKIVNRAGRAQLGLPMDRCEGFTAAQLQAIDFAGIDMTEFIADMLPADADLPEMTRAVEERVNQKASAARERLKQPLSAGLPVGSGSPIRPREPGGPTVYDTPHTLLVAAIEEGHASGVMEGDIAEHFTRQFRSDGELQVSAKAVQSHSQRACKRVAVEFRKQGVETPNGATEAILKTELNYCLDGAPPFAKR